MTIEQYARVPWRMREALRRDELTRDEFLTLVHLIATIGHDLWMLPVTEQVLVTELAVIGAETSWKKTTARLRQVLEELERKGWIGTRTRSGSKKWEIWLTGAAIVEKLEIASALGDADQADLKVSEPDPTDEKSEETGPQDFELSSKREGSAAEANAHYDSGNGPVEPRNADPSLDVDVDLDQHQVKGAVRKGRYVDEGPTHARTREEHLTLLPEVREAINRARVTRGEEPLGLGQSSVERPCGEPVRILIELADPDQEEMLLEAFDEIVEEGNAVYSADPRAPLCRYPAHRDAGLDWADGTRPVCGICHPHPRPWPRR